MKNILVALFLLLAPIAQAYNPITVDADKPFSQITISMDEVGQKQSYLGTLSGYPHLFEFVLEEDAVLEVQTRQRAIEESRPVNLILISVNPDTGRISEVVRSNAPIIERNQYSDRGLGISVIESELLELDLEAGLYRLEVSTSINDGPYELNFGNESNDNSYFGTFATISEVQRHFGYAWFDYFRSSFIYYQVGIVLMLSGFGYLLYRRKNTVENKFSSTSHDS